MINAYKPSSMSYQSLVTRFARPLPYSETLIDMSDASQRTSPFLCAYYESIGKEPPKLPTRKKATTTSTNDDDRDNEPQDVADEANHGPDLQTTALTATSLDQSRHAILTRQQHQRYQQWNTNPPTARNDRNEYKKIRALVMEERQLYLKALTTFWVAHLDRLGAAVAKSLPFIKAFQRQLYQTVASYTPTRYGKCRQVISMSAADGAGKFASLTLETVGSRVLVEQSADDDDKSLPPPNLKALPSVPRAILSSSDATKLTPLRRRLLLQNDAIALDLAQKHAVDILLPASVLQLLLGIMEQSTGQHDHDEIPSLILGVTRLAADKNNNKLLVVDDPLYLSCASPRRALEYGHQEGMYQMFSSVEVDNDDDTNDELTHSPSYQYTLLEFSRLPKTPLRVLVRSQVCLLLQHRPVQLSARIKFFGDRGQHLATECDRACWLLNHLLQTMTVVGHVDPNTSQVVGWDEPSLAYALTVTTNEAIHQQLCTNPPIPLSADPMACFKACAHFLASLTTVGAGHHVVQIPAVADDSTMSTNNKALSASVHAANADGNLDILALQQEQFASTHESLLKPEALLQCFQYWEWTADDRVPYTFPTETK